MTYFNPITGSILQTGQVQRHEAANKDREARRQALLKKGLSETDEEQVESTDTVITADDDHQNPKQQSKEQKQADDDEEKHLDLRA